MNEALSYGKWLKWSRKAVGWDQDDLAISSGLGLDQIRSIEAGQVEVTPDMVRNFAFILSAANRDRGEDLLALGERAPFGPWLKWCRKGPGVNIRTQFALASRLGYSKATIENVEQGDVPPSEQVIQLLVALFFELQVIDPGEEELFAAYARSTQPGIAWAPNDSPRMDQLEEEFAASAPAVQTLIRDFTPLIEERTSSFVGRGYIFQAIDDLISSSDFPKGYIVIIGEPGIGKTALLSKYIYDRGHVHHFNIAAQNIRSVRDFLENICAQLIARYNLSHNTLPQHALQDSGYLVQLLGEAVQSRSGPVVVVVDALDEAEDVGLAPGTNRLYLPATLPDQVYFVVTTRPKDDYRLKVDRPETRHDIYIQDDDPRNEEDIRDYVTKYVAAHQPTMAERIAQWQVDEEEFTRGLTQRSQGNFMYLVNVLRDIYEGKLSRHNIDNIWNLPLGLTEYYRRHWELMKIEDAERFERYYEPVACFLATAREPVSIEQLAEWADLSPLRVREAIAKWREFLNTDATEQGTSLYHIYHRSFQEYLEKYVGLVPYHARIATNALKKIPGFEGI